MFTRFMISKTFKGFSRRAIRIFSRSVIGVPYDGDGDGTRSADCRQQARSLDEVRSGSNATGLLGPAHSSTSAMPGYRPRSVRTISSTRTSNQDFLQARIFDRRPTWLFWEDAHSLCTGGANLAHKRIMVADLWA